MKVDDGEPIVIAHNEAGKYRRRDPLFRHLRADDTCCSKRHTLGFSLAQTLARRMLYTVAPPHRCGAVEVFAKRMIARYRRTPPG